jgi:hypothetical protein
MDIATGGLFAVLRFIFKPVLDVFGKLFFRNAYKVSTVYHNHREAFSFHSKELCKELEHKVFWRPYYLSKKLLTPMIWLKSVDQNVYSKVVLSVTAGNKKIAYQDQIVIYKVSGIPTQVALPSIPFRNLTFDRGGVYTPYDNIITRVEELYDAHGEPIELSGSTMNILCPFDRLNEVFGVERGDVEKWGEVFNLRLIESELKELKIRLIGPLRGSYSFMYRLKQKVFGKKWIVKSVFWIRNLIWARQLNSVLADYIDEFEDRLERPPS